MEFVHHEKYIFVMHATRKYSTVWQFWKGNQQIIENECANLC